jgi:hypothetical protein
MWTRFKCIVGCIFNSVGLITGESPGIVVLFKHLSRKVLLIFFSLFLFILLKYLFNLSCDNILPFRFSNHIADVVIVLLTTIRRPDCYGNTIIIASVKLSNVTVIVG